MFPRNKQKYAAEVGTPSIASQDPASMESLVQHHLDAVFGLCYRYLQNNADAEDATQEVFVKVWKNFSKFDAERDFQAWIMTIAKNTCLDILKKKKVIPFSAFETAEGINYLAETLPSGDPQPAEMAERSSFHGLLSLAQEKLSPAYQIVLDLYYKQGLNFREISEQLEQPLHTVKSRHRRAVIALKNLLGDQLA